jgi:hypothetical protein
MLRPWARNPANAGSKFQIDGSKMVIWFTTAATSWVLRAKSPAHF